MLINIGLDDAFFLGTLSSTIHIGWSIAAGGRLGFGNDPRYNKTRCFDPFPFPACDESLKTRIRELGEELDGHRKARQAERPELTMTGMYNVLEKVRAGATLGADDRLVYDKALVGVLRDIHHRLDAAVAEAYGWAVDLPEAEVLERLVALNHERAQEERRGLVRWLRSEYQAPRAKLPTPVQEEMVVDPAAAVAKAKAWPKKLPERFQALQQLLASADGAIDVRLATKGFRGVRREEVDEHLQTLVAMGQARRVGEGRYAA